MSDINEIISQKAIDGIIQTDKAITTLDEKTRQFVKSVETLSAALKTGDISFKQVQQAQKSVNTVTQKSIDIDKQRDAAAKVLDRQRQNGLATMAKLEAKEREMNSATKKSIDLQKQQDAAVAALEKQRSSGLAIMAKAEAKEREMNSAMTMTVKSEQDLITQTNALVSARKKLDLTTKEGVAARNQMTTQISENTAKLKQYDSEIGRSQKNVGNYRSAFAGLKSQLVGMIGMYASIYAVVAGIKKVISTTVNFEKALSSLSAITGATGQNLDFFKQKAVELSSRTLQSATDIVKAFEMVGSIRPELLKDKEGLAAVTEQAIILSEATGGKLAIQDAANSVAGVLNQYSLKTADAARVTNALAAGSKYGSAMVLDETESLKVFGAVADASNVTIEQSIGLTETLGEKRLLGAEAGTKLRNVLIKLQKDQDNFKNGVFDLNLALDRLATSNKTVTQLSKEFGLRNVVAAEILKNNRDKVRQYTEAVTGTSVALEQQAIQNDNLSGKMKKMGNAFTTMIISLNQSKGAFMNVIGSFVNLGTTIAKALTPVKSLSDQFDEQNKKVSNLNDNISPLLDRYDALKSKTNLSKIEQEELKKIILQISEAIPSAITQFDKYGGAIDISTEAGRKAIKVQQQMNEILNAKAIKEQTEKLKKYSIEVKYLTHIEKTRTEMTNRGVAYRISDEELNSVRARLGLAQLNLEATQKIIDGYKGIKEISQKSADETAASDLKEQISKGKVKDSIKSLNAELLKTLEAGRKINKTDKDAVVANNAKVKAINDELDKLNKANDEKIAGQKKVSEEIKAASMSAMEKEMAAIDKKALKWKNEGGNEIEIAKWVNTQREAIYQKSDDKVLAGYYAMVKKIDEQSTENALKMGANIDLSGLPDPTTPEDSPEGQRLAAIIKLAQNAGKKEVSISKLTMDEINNLYSKGSLTYKQYEELKTQITETESKKREKKLESELSMVKEFGDAIFKINANILQGKIDNIQAENTAQQNSLDDQLNNLQDEKQEELDAAKGNAAKTNQINNHYADLEKQLKQQKTKDQEAATKKENELKRKQAINNKIEAMFDIAINTAIGAVKAVAESPLTGGMPFLAWVLAMGAAQEAVVLSQPIPKFYAGTDSAPGGAISVAERGGELVSTRSGEALYFDKPTITSGLEGAKIYTNEETKEIFSKAGKDDSFSLAMDKHTRTVVDAIKNKKEFHWNARTSTITEREGNYFKEYRNKKLDIG